MLKDNSVENISITKENEKKWRENIKSFHSSSTKTSNAKGHCYIIPILNYLYLLIK